MKPGHRILFSIYISFIVYSSVSMIWGPAGILQTSKLNLYKEKLIQNTSELREISSQLVLQSNNLRSDQDLIALKARELGFFELGEGEIVIKGYQKKNINFSVGSFYKNFSVKIVNINNIRFFSLIAGFIVYLILTIFINKRPLYKKRLQING